MIARALVALAALLLAPAASGWWSQPTLDGTASWLAQRDVSVRCLTQREAERLNVAGGWTPGHAVGRGWWFAPRTMLSPGYCEAVLSLLDPESAWARGTQAAALMVLVHESGHMRNARWSASEAGTQRWALQRFRSAALRLGLEPALASELLVHAVAFHLALPASYRASDCRRPRVVDGLLRGCG